MYLRLIFSLHLSVTNILEAEKKIKQKGISKRIKKNMVKQEEKENENEKMRKKQLKKEIKNKKCIIEDDKKNGRSGFVVCTSLHNVN